MEGRQTILVNQAPLEAHLRGEDVGRADRRIHEALRARQRHLAWLSFAGVAAGAAITYFSGVRVARGIIWGGVAGMVLAKILDWWRHRADAP